MNYKVMLVCSWLVSALVFPSAVQAAPKADKKGKAAADQPLIPPSAFQAKGFEVIGHQIEVRSGLHVWTVRHPASGQKTVIYSTPKNEVFFSGAMWDGETGANVSDVFYTSPLMSGSGAASEPRGVPDAIRQLSALTGIKDGDSNAPIEKTLFVFFDPRCPYCKRLYEMTRNQSAMAGRAIVWLPVAVLGKNDHGRAIIADILQRKKPIEGLQIAFSGFGSSDAKPSKETLTAIQENERIFWAAFHANPGAGQAAVPVAFFMDKAGQPQMVADPTTTLVRIFQEMN